MGNANAPASCHSRSVDAPQSSTQNIWVRGEPKRYAAPGHHARKLPVEYTVEDRSYATPCWIWQRAKSPKGYGYIRITGVLHLAHRVYYERVHGPVPDELQTDHLCRVRACVNPDHLEAVTGTTNQRRGNTAKLSLVEARHVRVLYATSLYSYKTLAERFDVGKTAIRNIVNNKNWKESD